MLYSTAQQLKQTKFNNSNQYATTSFVQEALGNVANASTITAANTTLTVAQAGQAFLFSTASASVVLPTASSVPAGGTYKLHTSAGFTLSVTGGGAMQAGNASVTSLPVPAGTEVLAVSTGTAWWVFGTGQTLSNLGLVGGLRNLKASATGTSAVVTVTADQIALDSTAEAPPLLVSSVSVSPSLASSGANGLDIGTSAASTWYSVWVISNGTTTAGLLSLSAIAPTMPSGYTYRRRVGWVRTDATANKYPLAFTQNNADVVYKIGSNPASPRVCASGSTGSITAWTAVSVASYVPPTAYSINVTVGGGLSASSVAVAPNNGYPTVTLSPASSPPLLISMTSTSGSHQVSTGDIALESTSIYWLSTTTTGHVQINGWRDSL